MIDERSLISEIKSGSERSYRILYEHWVSRLYYFVYRYVKSKSITDDIVQETFFRIWDKRKTLNPDSSFKSYLFTISYHLLIKELRRQLNNPLMEEYIQYNQKFILSEDESDRQLEFELFLEALSKAKQKLPPRQREIFEMNKEYNMSIQEIAEQLSMGVQVVRNQLSAALKTLRADLGQYASLFILFILKF